MLKLVNKDDLIAELSERTHNSKTLCREMVNELADIIVDNVAIGESVRLIGFGTFEPRHRAGRRGRNPQTGREIQIPACTIPSFKAGKYFKESVRELDD